MADEKESWVKGQLIPLILTGVAFVCLLAMLFALISGLNRLHLGREVAMRLRWGDILFGLTIYLKTSVDFAIFIGNLIKINPGYRRRIAVEIGTALGNALGTFTIMALWFFFKELRLLLAIMVLLASLVLLRLAQDGLEHARTLPPDDSKIKTISQKLDRVLEKINRLFHPLLRHIIPHSSFRAKENLGFWPLLGFAFTVPFILGLDDFAGYVPLFSIVNIYGFGAGVLGGHMILNALLYISPQKTIQTVTNPAVSLLGCLVFIGLALYGFSAAIKLFF